MNIQGYDINGRIGFGATSEVFAAKKLQDGTSVALKRFIPIIAQDPEMRQRLEIEAETLATLCHPNIVALKGIFRDQDTWGLELELVDGQALPKWKESHPLELIEPRLWILAQIAQGIAAAHAEGVIHRDLKPENVLISSHGMVKLTDFGLARTLTRATITRSGVLLGSLAYMPPEVLRLEDADTRSDIYSYGIIAYQLLSGELPFDAESPQGLIKQISESEAMALHLRTPHVPLRISRLVQSCLAKAPELRPQSAWHIHAEIMQELLNSGLMKLAPLLITTPFATTTLAEALRIKHERLILQATKAKSTEEKLEVLNALKILFPTSESLPELLTTLNHTKKSSSSRSRWWMALALLLLTTTIWWYKTDHDGFIKATTTEKATPPNPVNIPVMADTVTSSAVNTVTATTVSKIPSPKPAVTKRAVVSHGFIRFEVPEDVIVFVDGTEVPRQFLSRWSVAPGPHRLRLIRQGYQPIDGQVHVKAEDTSVVRIGESP